MDSQASDNSQGHNQVYEADQKKQNRPQGNKLDPSEFSNQNYQNQPFDTLGYHGQGWNESTQEYDNYANQPEFQTGENTKQSGVPSFPRA